MGDRYCHWLSHFAIQPAHFGPKVQRQGMFFLLVQLLNVNSPVHFLCNLPFCSLGNPSFYPSWTLLNKALGYMLLEQRSQPVSSLEKFGGLRYISILKVLVSFNQRWELIQSPWKLISYKSECIPFYVSKAIITDLISNHCYSGLVMLWDNALRYPRNHFTREGISL